MQKVFTAVAVLSLCGCASLAPDAVRVEWEHISHPLAGPPFGPTTEEDCLDQLNVALHWQNGAWFVESGLGYKLADAGMYGPKLTFTSRVGREFKFGN